MTSENKTKRLERLLDRLHNTEPGWKDFYERVNIVEALSRLGDPRALPALEEIVLTDTQKFDAWGMDFAISVADFAEDAINQIRRTLPQQRQIVAKLSCTPPEPVGMDEISTYRKVTEMYFMWRNESLDKMGTVRSQLVLLLEGRFGPLSDEQHKATEKIYQICSEAVDSWHYPAEYLSLCCEQEIELEVLSLAEILKKVAKDSQEYHFIEKVDVDLPESLPRIIGTWRVGVAIAFLITGVNLFTGIAVTPRIGVRCVEKTVDVQIDTGIPRRHKARVISELSEPGTRYNLAKSIIQQQNRQLEVTTSQNSILFEFSLPAWLGETNPI